MKEYLWGHSQHWCSEPIGESYLLILSVLFFFFFPKLPLFKNWPFSISSDCQSSGLPLVGGEVSHPGWPFQGFRDISRHLRLIPPSSGIKPFICLSPLWEAVASVGSRAWWGEDAFLKMRPRRLHWEKSFSRGKEAHFPLSLMPGLGALYR